MTVRTKTWGAGTATTVIIVSMFGALLLALSIWLVQSYYYAERQVEERVEAASKIMATNATWLNALAWQALERIDLSLGTDISTQSDEIRHIREAVGNLPGIVQAYVVDAAGRTRYSTDPDLKPIDIRDRDYYSALKDGAKTYLSPLLVSRLNGRQIFVFSRALIRNGQFAGAAMVSFEASILGDIWASVGLGQNSTVGLIRTDGQLVARYPYPPDSLNMKSYVLFTEHLPRSANGTYKTVSPVDQVKRTVGYRTVVGTDFIAVASADSGAAMEPFWQSVYVALAMIVFSAAGCATAAGWIGKLHRRDAKQTASLAIALESNKLLMREIHHRVKNNLQAIGSLLRMQRLPEPILRSLLDRLSAMVAVHEQIYGQDRFSRLSADELLKAVVSTLVSAYRPEIRVVYAVEPLEVGTDQATPLALLVNEVVTNSLKYAFPDGRAGLLQVALSDLGSGRVRLRIADDGVGMARQSDDEALREGMGSRLIAGVVSQLGGRFDYSNEGGTVFTAELELGGGEAGSI